jgi:type IV pilus assembly protein PilF
MKKLIILIFILGCASDETEKSKELTKAEIYYDQGTKYLVEKNYTEALEMLLKAAEIAPGDSKVHNNLGMSYYFKQQFDLSEKHLMNALKLDPKNSDARNNLASLYYERGLLDKATEQYQIILADLVYQHQYRIHYNLALINLKKNRTYEAQSELELSLKEKADYCPAHALMGKIEKAAKNYEKALAHFKSGILGACFSNPEMHYLKAIGLIDVGNYPEAKLALKDLNLKFKNSPYTKLALDKLVEIEQKHGLSDETLDTLPSSQQKILKEVEEEEFESVKF